MRVALLTISGLIASLTAASAQYYGPAASAPAAPQQLNNPPPRGTYTQPFGTDPGAGAPYGVRGNLNANGYNPATPQGQAPLTSGGYSLGGRAEQKP